MKNDIKKIGVLTSGGDAPGMNAAIRAVVRACVFNNLECVGIYRGYQGLIEGEFKIMNARSVKNIINRGGTILKSARSNDFFSKEGRQAAYEKLKAEAIDALITIMDGNHYGWDFELGRGKNISVNEVAKMMNITPIYKDNKPGEARHTLNTDNTANKILGWNPQRELLDYLKKTIENNI